MHIVHACIFGELLQHPVAEIGGKNAVSLLSKKDVYGSRAAAHVENGFAGQYPGPFDEFFGVGVFGVFVVIAGRALVPALGARRSRAGLLDELPFLFEIKHRVPFAVGIILTYDNAKGGLRRDRFSGFPLFVCLYFCLRFAWYN